MRQFIVGLAVATLAAWGLGATAAEKPAFGPPPAWVEVAPLPTVAAGDAGAVQTLLDDNQSRLTAEGDAYYVHRAYKILKTEGLAGATTQSQTWDPDTDEITFHWLRILRDGQTIDLLGGGEKMLTLRRERELEHDVLDGRITASQQIEGLQVGDVLDFAWTLTRRDPILQGRSYAAEGKAFQGRAGRYRVRLTWDAQRPLSWRATPGFGEPKVSTRGGLKELLLDQPAAAAPDLPTGAPMRYARLGQFEASGFQSWDEVSALMFPLYETASALSADSPLRQEAAAIAARTQDPKERAFAALQLVQDKTRYFLLGMGDGGYVPATAEETWVRRFGDCKGKTALLLALLDALEVPAEAALVNLRLGDGLDERVPSLAAFDHVLVRTTLDGTTYWLDGTGSGAAGGLDALDAPTWRWALPVRRAGAGLEQVAPAALTSPQADLRSVIDASKGLDQPADTRLEMHMRGQAAAFYRQGVNMGSEAEVKRSLRDAFGNMTAGFSVEQVEWKDDSQSGTFVLTVTGKWELDWRTNPDLQVRELEVLVSRPAQGAPMFPRREPGAFADAPFAVAHPYYIQAVTEIVLPNKGEGFLVRGPIRDQVIGGYEWKQSAGLENGAARFSSSVRSVGFEVSPDQAEEANRIMRQTAGEEALIRAPR